MIAMYSKGSYNSVEDAIEGGGLYATSSTIDSDYTAVMDCLETMSVVLDCLGCADHDVAIFYKHENIYVPIKEYLDIVSQ